jgi:putative redox protein
VKLTVEHVAGLRFQTTVGGHTVDVDAAPEDGGTDIAPSAPQLFAAAVGACMLEFVVNSCRLREISFERLSLEIEFEEKERPRRIGALEATIHIEPDLPEDVKQRLIGVARHATLANTLARPPELAVKFV